MKSCILMIAIVLCWLVPPVLADDGPDTRTSVKINRAKRHQLIKDNNSDEETQVQAEDEDPCKGVEIGNIYTDRRQSRIRENIVIVTGDVISVPSKKCK